MRQRKGRFRSLERSLAKKCKARDGWRCQHCGRFGGRLEAHHVVRIRDGGARFALDNLLTLCRGCHISVHQTETHPMARLWRDFVMDLVREQSVN